MIYHSVGGGFGGSYASYLLSQFEDDFSKVIKSTVSFLSSDQNSSSTIVEPYNSVFTINQLKKFSDFNIFIDNHALLKVCENQLDLDQANYDIFNRMITQMVSSITSSQRFNKDQFIDLLDLYQNLVQLPQLQFLHSSFAPFISKDKENTKIITLSSISESLFNEVGSFMKYSPDHLKYFGANLFFQGDCSYQEIQSTITDLKSFKSINFADWVPFNYQIAFSQKSTIQFPNCELGRTSKTACLVANSLQILNPMKNIQSRFKNLYQRKCFLHWFLTRTDMKESQFQEDLELFSSLILNYEELKSIDQIQEKINYEDEVSIEEARDQINDNK
ncbi:unnamed protein product [Paramecium sonneborni]|uniref:Uncharacterized protein n=1 Tax=Paramecium sonneborni TaxID=65129 RepID=A0A8S1KR75_9CILI|nr:unnamed protein product [Paramecium sonneborni]